MNDVTAGRPGSPASQMVNLRHSVFHLLSSFVHDEKLPKC